MPRLEQRSCSLVRVSRTSGCVTTEFQPLRRCNRLACCEFQEVAFRFFVRRYHKIAEQEPLAAELKSRGRAASCDSLREPASRLGGRSRLVLRFTCSCRRTVFRCFFDVIRIIPYIGNTSAIACRGPSSEIHGIRAFSRIRVTDPPMDSLNDLWTLLHFMMPMFGGPSQSRPAPTRGP